eukprot:28371-Eustigmatos_ZCMA.PRE.1
MEQAIPSRKCCRRECPCPGERGLLPASFHVRFETSEYLHVLVCSLRLRGCTCFRVMGPEPIWINTVCGRTSSVCGRVSTQRLVVVKLVWWCNSCAR